MVFSSFAPHGYQPDWTQNYRAVPVAPTIEISGPQTTGYRIIFLPEIGPALICARFAVLVATGLLYDFFMLGLGLFASVMGLLMGVITSDQRSVQH